VGAVAKALKSYWGQETSDPAKVAQVVLRLAESESLPAHLLIGSDAVRFATEAETTRAADAERWRGVSVSTDVSFARFKQLCTPEELQIKISKDECLIEPFGRQLPPAGP
jgi:hypothetical protein